MILHGTDTLAYTASMLSFLLEKLTKTVIVTGSQVPIFEKNSDGLGNFCNAVAIAGNFFLPEVSVVFNGKLFRGNRVSKVHSMDFNGFDSPNYPVIMGFKGFIEAEVFPSCEEDDEKTKKFRIHTEVNKNVVVIRIFPGMRVDMLKEMMAAPVQGVVFETFGAGNMPTARGDFMEVIKKASERGVLIINVSQCVRGGVIELYETGKLDEYGVISGHGEKCSQGCATLNNP